MTVFAETIESCRQIDSGHIDRAMFDVDMFSKHLYTRYTPDLDRADAAT